MYKIVRYGPSYKKHWDSFVKANLAPFLFYRDYMEYHQHKFSDCSLMVFEGDELIALFPANLDGMCLRSHSGLTYGGLVTSNLIKTSKSLKIFSSIFDFARENNIREIVYKCVPNFYKNLLNESELYSIYRFGGKLTSRAVSSGINLTCTIFPAKKASGARRALREGLIFNDVLNLELFFKEFNENLLNRYRVSAVHSAAEMAYLRNKFPENILNYAAYDDKGRMCAGVILYIVGQVVHVQYMLNTEAGKMHRALDFIFLNLYEKFKFENYTWIEFGTSTTNNGYELNENLVKQKEDFGAIPICYDIYTLNVT